MSTEPNLTNNYKAIIEKEVSTVLQNIDPKDLKFKSASNLHKWICIALIAISGFVLIAAVQLTIFKSLDMYILILGYVLSIPTLIGSCFWFKIISQKKRVAEEILAHMDITNIYKSAFNELFYPNFEYLDIAPQFLVPPYVYPSGDTRINNVINFKDDNGNIFSIGSITKKVVKQHTSSDGKKTTTTYYYCYRILSAYLAKKFDMDTKISHKRFLSKDNAVLESQEFEKIYATVTDNQIELRKLLTPKVIENLNKLASYYGLTIPEMHFAGNSVTFIFPSTSVSGFYDVDNTLQHIFFKQNNKVQEEITAKVEYDYKYIKRIFVWFKAFELID